VNRHLKYSIGNTGRDCSDDRRDAGRRPQLSVARRVSSRMGSICVLVVDDFELWRSMVSSRLKNELHLAKVFGASDGLEAVRKAEELQPDLVLLDIGLPCLNGVDAAHQIRLVAPNARVLFLTSKCDRTLAEAALRTGAAGYVIKSDAGRELIAAVEAVIAGKRFVSERLCTTNDFAFDKWQSEV
jgi:DNA-binding NarL/FixJ family response regulator